MTLAKTGMTNAGVRRDVAGNALRGMASRRDFISCGTAAIGAFALGGCQCGGSRGGAYTVSILGDTHFDAAPLSTYHSKWRPRDQQDWKDRQGEFKRNLDMWTTGRVPRLIAAAAKTRRADTAFLLHMGDLIQGDCTDAEVYARYFHDAAEACTRGFGDIPFLVVCGNHDVRGGGEKAFDDFALPLAARAMGARPSSANYMLRHGPDAYLFMDFMRPDPAATDAMLAASEGARHTFICSHGCVAPTDTWGPYWFLFGEREFTDYRRDLFARLLARRAIFLCGHLHKTQLRRWRRDGGELVEFCANSVWRAAVDKPKTLIDSPAQFGQYVRKHTPRVNEDYDGRKQPRTPEELFALADEYVAGLVEYRMLAAAGHYLLRVSDSGVAVDFYACDSLFPTERYSLVGEVA